MAKNKLTPTFNDTKEIKASQPSMVLPKEEVSAVLGTMPQCHIIPAHEPLDGEAWPPSEMVKMADEPENKTGTDEPPCPCEALPEPMPNIAPQITVKPSWWDAADPGPEGKVALLGTAPSSRLLAPFNDKSWRIWSCSPGNMNVVPRWDVWFEIHSTLTWPENQGYGMPYLKWLSEQKNPVFMQDIDENKVNVPNFIPFPVNEMLQEFGPFFFTSSFAWMMALAIKRGAKQIALFGIDMASRDEYILQRPGAYYFFMEAGRRGIAIGAPHESDIMQPPPPYGYFESSSFGRKLCTREKELKDRINPMKQELAKLQANITYLEGALEDVDYYKNIWGGAQLFGQGQRLAIVPNVIKEATGG